MEPSPPIASILGTSAQNDADARRLAAISADSPSLCASGRAKRASVFSTFYEWLPRAGMRRSGMSSEVRFR